MSRNKIRVDSAENTQQIKKTKQFHVDNTKTVVGGGVVYVGVCVCLRLLSLRTRNGWSLKCMKLYGN